MSTIRTNTITDAAGTGAPDFTNGLKFNGNQVNGVIGAGQTWQDVSASRTMGTTYTNTTGKPIQLSINILGGAVNATATLTVASTVISRVVTGANFVHTFFAIIPPSATYVLTNVSNSSVHSWFELR